VPKIQRLPKFKSDIEESDWWDKQSPEKILSESVPVDIRFRLKGDRKVMVSLRLDRALIGKAKALAKVIDAPYQRVLRAVMERGIDAEIHTLLSDKKIGPRLRKSLIELRKAV